MIQSISFAFLLLPTASPRMTPTPQHQPFFVLFCLCYSKLLTKDFLSWNTLAKLAAVWVWLMGGTGRRNRPECFFPIPLWFDKNISVSSFIPLRRRAYLGTLFYSSSYQRALLPMSPQLEGIASVGGHHPLLVPLNLHTSLFTNIFFL